MFLQKTLSVVSFVALSSLSASSLFAKENLLLPYLGYYSGSGNASLLNEDGSEKMKIPLKIETSLKMTYAKKEGERYVTPTDIIQVNTSMQVGPNVVPFIYQMRPTTGGKFEVWRAIEGVDRKIGAGECESQINDSVRCVIDIPTKHHEVFVLTKNGELNGMDVPKLISSNDAETTMAAGKAKLTYNLGGAPKGYTCFDETKSWKLSLTYIGENPEDHHTGDRSLYNAVLKQTSNIDKSVNSKTWDKVYVHTRDVLGAYGGGDYDLYNSLSPNKDFSMKLHGILPDGYYKVELEKENIVLACVKNS